MSPLKKTPKRGTPPGFLSGKLRGKKKGPPAKTFAKPPCERKKSKKAPFGVKKALLRRKLEKENRKKMERAPTPTRKEIPRPAKLKPEDPWGNPCDTSGPKQHFWARGIKTPSGRNSSPPEALGNRKPSPFKLEETRKIPREAPGRIQPRGPPELNSARQGPWKKSTLNLRDRRYKNCSPTALRLPQLHAQTFILLSVQRKKTL